LHAHDTTTTNAAKHATALSLFEPHLLCGRNLDECVERPHIETLGV
jgi:hypothetical protein